MTDLQTTRRFSLAGSWEMSAADENDWHSAQVPGSVYADLIREGLMDDPFFGENEQDALAISGKDFYYKKDFDYSFGNVTDETYFDLVCEGIDTLADIYINGVFIGHCENMHTGYRFAITDALIDGSNEIIIKFQSPYKYVQAKNTRKPLWGMDEATAVQGFPHIRKSHCQFGWDWGPKLPDMGIWRDIYIERTDGARITDVYVQQENSEDFCHLTIDIRNMLFTDAKLEYALYNPSGKELVRTTDAASEKLVLTIDIKDPDLWWPAGYGDQPLYKLVLTLRRDDQILCVREQQIGIRTINVIRRKDKWGESFVFEVNGREIFMKGANYIPEDAIFAHRTRERTTRLLEDCVRSHFNCIRVWGGGHYGEDHFYDECDRLGLIVWQDFMFACAVYDMTENMEENLRAEFVYNIKRLRNHASLGIWCGNNEIESAWAGWGIPENAKLRADYMTIFENMIPSILEDEDPGRFYWPSSPSSGGGFADPSSEHKGDAHYWDVWHGKRPFEDIEKKYFRFFSEYGFEALPDIRTLRSVIAPEQMSIVSPQMEAHQKCVDGNLTLVHYLLRYYPYPTDFSRMIYLTQALQGDYLEMAIRHLRSNRGRCAGSIYWQINDTWPTISWASIDYYGRWKGAQYIVKRSYAPLIAYAEFEEYANRAQLFVSGECLDAQELTVFAQWIDQERGVIAEKSCDLTLSPLSAINAFSIDIPEEALHDSSTARRTFLHYGIKRSDGSLIDSGNRLLVPPKHFAFADPQLDAHLVQDEDAADGALTLEISASAFARRVGITFTECDVQLSDNFFDLLAGEHKKVKLTGVTADQLDNLQKQLVLQSNFV